MPTAAAAEIPIIDCDIHPTEAKLPVGPYIEAKHREALRQGMGSQPGQGYSNPFGVQRRDAACDTPEQLAEQHLDRFGIAYGVLQPPGMSAGLSVNIDMGTAKARAWNEWQAAEWLRKDDRLLASICVNMADPAAAAAEIRRARALHPRFVQVLASGESHDLYGHRRYFPVFEACAEEGIPFALHPGAEGALRSSTPVGRPSGYFEWHSGIPLTFQAHLISLVTEGVFEKFPGLKLVLVEGGIAWLVHTMWRLDKNFKSLRSTTPWLKRRPSEYILENVRLTTQPLEEPDDPEQLLQVFAMIEARRTVCFASDFPHWDFDDPRRILPRRIDPTLRDRILYGNAAELYNLPPLPTPAAPASTAREVAHV